MSKFTLNHLISTYEGNPLSQVEGIYYFRALLGELEIFFQFQAPQFLKIKFQALHFQKDDLKLSSL